MNSKKLIEINKYNQKLTIAIKQEHHISQARIDARLLSEKIGLNNIKLHEVVTSVSELASNIFFHAINGGTIQLNVITKKGNTGMEVIATDKGPGIEDVKLAMQDGFTTNGGLGGGLPGVKRLMDNFKIISEPGVGTTITTIKWKK